MEREHIEISELGTICIINGQRWLHDTEQAVYEFLVNDRNTYPMVLDNLFEQPEKIKAIKYYNPDTIMLGTTGVYRDKINLVLNEFTKLEWLPKNALFTMGEEYFGEFAKSGVIGYKMYPYARYFKEDPVIRKLESYEF